MSTTAQISLPETPTGSTGLAATLVFSGVEQAGPSFEGRVFIDNAAAGPDTPRVAESGYLGSFHLYGLGSPEPPAIADARAAAGKGQTVAPIEKRVHVDDPAILASLADREQVTVTVVAVPVAPGDVAHERAFERVEVVFGRAGR